jgi:hypothetical protein
MTSLSANPGILEMDRSSSLNVTIASMQSSNPESELNSSSLGAAGEDTRSSAVSDQSMLEKPPFVRLLGCDDPTLLSSPSLLGADLGVHREDL